MTTILTSAALGALVRQTREGANLTQTQLAERIGASRFWVAAFEKGKPSAELGLALKAVQALGLTILIEASPASSDGTLQEVSATPMLKRTQPLKADSTLAKVIANASLTNAPPSKVVGWPGVESPTRRKRPHA